MIDIHKRLICIEYSCIIKSDRQNEIVEVKIGTERMKINHGTKKFQTSYLLKTVYSTLTKFGYR